MFCIHCGNEIREGTKFCTTCGSAIQTTQLKEHKNFLTRKRLVIFSILLLIILPSVAFLFYSRYEKPSTADIASAVVNIYCENTPAETSSGGSGTIFTEDGLVLTNAHIIPSSNGEEGVTCIIVLPDPTTGSPKEIYYGYPIIVPTLSEKYDLAFMQIHDVYYDREEGKALGEYPKKFPAYATNRRCGNDTELVASFRHRKTPSN